MSMINELLDKLYKYAAEYDLPPFGREIDGTKELLREAADTIESLSAKLAKANMERSDAYYGGGRKLQSGDIVQHFKREMVEDKKHSMEYLYIIKEIAIHTETNEKLVVYQALYKNDEKGVHFNSSARPYDMFMTEVDHEKYPEIKQKYRFELFDLEKELKT